MRLPTLATLGLLLHASAACNWISLARYAATYDTTRSGDAANIVVGGSRAYVTLAGEGVGVLDVESGARLVTVPPPRGTDSVDDLALDGTLLFVLDARPPGHVSVFSVRDTLPVLVGAPRPVPVGPFSGVSAASGLLVVSGGTSALTAWRYDSTGVLGGDGPAATADLGRGQPDVTVHRALAVVSTHYWGPYFGVSLLRFDSATSRLEPLAELALEDAGFTAGGAKPANFPIEAAVLDDSTVLVAHARSVAVVDIGSPGQPRVVQRVDVGGPAVNVDAAKAIAVVAIGGPHPAAVLLHVQGRSVRVGRRIALPDRATPAGVALAGRRILVAARARGVLLFDI